VKHARDDYDRRIVDLEEKIPADEPVFILRAQDKVAAETVRIWANLNEDAGGDPELSRLARNHAIAMDAWPVKKAADR
jgi:hypothetical protein